MTRTGKATGTDALNEFRTLEDRITRVLDALGDTRRDKDRLVQQLNNAREQIRQLETELTDLRKERKLIRGRVQEMVREITRLERKSVTPKRKTQVV